MEFINIATIKRFEDIHSWQKARILSKEIYTITKIGEFSKDYDLKNQIRKASESVMDNIAEGFERGGKGEFVQFLGITKGSSGEVRSQLYRALDQGYIDKKMFNTLYSLSDEISKLIKGMITYLNSTVIKGQKYKKRSNSKLETLN